MSFIRVEQLVRNFGKDKGIFGLDIAIERGETFGFVGTNSAGKTTTIRHLMGFIRQDSGRAEIDGLDCWKDAARIKRLTGYIPGEIAFPDCATGMDFLRHQADLYGCRDLSYCHYIIDKLQLDPTANLKRMSKGMKQKTAITAAFMHDPELLILDEPSTGLDPLMRAAFVELLEEEKKKGKTIFMSSHMFDEVEDTCSRVALIRGGKIVSTVVTDDIRHSKTKSFKMEFLSADDYTRFLSESFDITSHDRRKRQVTVGIHDSRINELIAALAGYRIKFFSEIKYTLEQYFNRMYKETSGDIQ